MSDEDYVELSSFVYGKTYSSDVARRMMYGSRATLDILSEYAESNVTDKQYLEELKERQRRLRKDTIKLRTEKLEYNRWLREDARDEMFLEQVLEAIRNRVGKDDNLPVELPIVHNKREGRLCLADPHFGKQFKIYGLNNEVINEYSPEIFYERMDAIFNETLEIIEKEKLTSLRVYNLGDSVEGFIRHSQIWTLRFGVTESAITFGNYMGKWLKRLSQKVRITYAQTDGNHDELRLLDGKKNAHKNESAGSIVLNTIEILNDENPNFELKQNKTGLIYDEICGYNILGIHGECKKPELAIKEYADIYNINISYLILGHKHHSDFTNCGIRKGCIGIGSIIGSDPFSMDIRKAADATCSLVIFEENKGKVAEYTYVLN